MRAIKFEYLVNDKERGWCKETFPLFDLERGYFDSWVRRSKFGLKTCAQPIVRRQFTGLHDKNGKEIYEGDICDLVFVGGDEYGSSKVIFDAGAFTLVCSPQYEPCLYEADDRYIEVIGNIHENPELLKE